MDQGAGHIDDKRLLRLMEVDAAGPGIAPEFDAFLLEVAGGGAGGKIRVAQTRKYWDSGMGSRLGIGMFADLLSSIPSVPKDLLVDNPEFPFLTLVDARLHQRMFCNLAKVKYQWRDDNVFRPFDDHHKMPIDMPYWIRSTNGRPNLDKKPSGIRSTCTGNRFAGTVDVGLAFCIQHGNPKHAIDLPGSVSMSNRGLCACLHEQRKGELELDMLGSDGTDPGYGTLIFILSESARHF